MTEAVIYHMSTGIFYAGYFGGRVSERCWIWLQKWQRMWDTQYSA